VPIVYHYTGTQAFAGIVEKAALWATDFRYLNDARELRYTWDPFVAKLRQLSLEPREYSEAYAAQLKALELMDSVDQMGFDDSMFVACFTELRDAVSQWSRLRRERSGDRSRLRCRRDTGASCADLQSHSGWSPGSCAGLDH
jgi:hypothetical protein